jgi:glutamate dehydrogenase
LHREYGDNVKIVGIADGSGYAEDPQGLHMPELLRLVEASVPIAAFDPSLLSVEGVLTPADTLQRSKLRNSMHMRVVADAFLPAGGRPSTINASNWRSYLLPNGAPSSPLIVEGANLFISPEARYHLAEVRVILQPFPSRLHGSKWLMGFLLCDIPSK